MVKGAIHAFPYSLMLKMKRLFVTSVHLFTEVKICHLHYLFSNVVRKSPRDLIGEQ